MKRRSQRFTVSTWAVLVFSMMCAIVTGAAADAAAQATAAGLRGVVKDQTGAVVPGATVTAKGVDTGQLRTAVTDNGGRYALPQLAVGTYEVSAELTGFRREVHTGLRLTVGTDVVVDFNLQLGELTEQVQVSSEATVVNTTSASIAGLVDEKKIRELPLNGRDFLQLALLEAGATSVLSASTQVTTNKGFGLRVSFAGARPSQTSFLLDGTDIANTSNFRTPGSAAGVVLGVDTIREFQVLVNSFSAEFGNAAGGVINAVTKSGTNSLHGTGFEFLRDSKLDARNFFDRERPPFRRNQFGGTAGGPILRNKTFFFGGYEGLRENFGQTLIGLVPTADAREGRLPTRTVTVSPLVRPFLALYPLPNGRDYGNGTAEYLTSRSLPTTEDFYVVKIDHNITKNDALAGRFSFDDAEKQSFPNPIPNFAGTAHTRSQYFMLEEKKILTPRLLNLFRFSLNRSLLETFDRPLVSLDPSTFFVPGEFFGTFNFGTTGSGTLSNPGVNGSNPNTNELLLFQYADTLTYTRGSHLFKSGFNVNRYHYNGASYTRPGGEYFFSSIEGFLQGVSTRLRIADPSGDRQREWRQYLFGLFVQDDYRVRSNLTLNLGVRYEFISVPTDTKGRVSTLRDAFNDRQMTVGDPLFENPSLKNFAPRLGVVWDPRSNGRTSIRAGFGIYHDQITTNYLNQLDSNPPFFFSAQIANPSFPNALEVLRSRPPAAGLAAINTIEFRAKQPYLMQFNASVEREIMANTALTVGYVGSRGYNLQRIVNANPRTPVDQADGRLFFPSTAPFINPAFAAIQNRVQDGRSFYNSLQLRLKRRFNDGLQYQVAYTLAKSVDDATVGQGPTDYAVFGAVLHPFDPTFDRGLSNFDVRHNLTFNFTYELPFGRQLHGLAAGVLKGWQVSGIGTIRSGSPFMPIVGFDVANTQSLSNGTRPNLAPGASSNPTSGVTTGCAGIPAGEPLGTPSRYFDPCAFELQQRGYLGNLPRNTIIGPGLATFDLSLAKHFSLGAERVLQVRIEAFNLFNRANFATPSNVIVFDQAGYVSSAGRITSTVTTSRQMQVGFRVVF